MQGSASRKKTNKLCFFFCPAPGAYFTFRFYRFKTSCKSRLRFKEDMQNNIKKNPNEIYLHISKKKKKKALKEFQTFFKKKNKKKMGMNNEAGKQTHQWSHDCSEPVRLGGVDVPAAAAEASAPRPRAGGGKPPGRRSS